MPYRDEDIVSGGRVVRPLLTDLLGDDWIDVDRTLGTLLARADAAEPVADLIFDLLTEREPTRDWLRDFLGAEAITDVTRSYQPAPGHGEPIAARRYRCPHGDYDWYRRAAAQPVPACPQHRVPLEPA